MKILYKKPKTLAFVVFYNENLAHNSEVYLLHCFKKYFNKFIALGVQVLSAK